MDFVLSATHSYGCSPQYKYDLGIYLRSGEICDGISTLLRRGQQETHHPLNHGKRIRFHRSWRQVTSTFCLILMLISARYRRNCWLSPGFPNRVNSIQAIRCSVGTGEHKIQSHFAGRLTSSSWLSQSLLWTMDICLRLKPASTDDRSHKPGVADWEATSS
jgi:hypothetical protein